ncbi:MAG: glycosyltransferase family 8 protein [Dysgonomonas sp.]
MEIDGVTNPTKCKMNIVLCTDENYIMPCGITMVSLLENDKDNIIIFHIMGIELKEKSKEKLSLICSQYRNASIMFYDAKEKIINLCYLSPTDYQLLNNANYIRLFLGDILSENIDKVLYLDCDIIVSDNLSDLWNTNIENYSLAGVPDLHICCSHPETFNRLGYSDKEQYINSGVLLINLKYWREKNIISTFVNYAREKHGNLLLQDQDIINGVLYDSILSLPIRFNIINTYYWSKNNDTAYYWDEIYAALIDPAIIHFTSPEKPWLKLCMHPLKKEFIRYKNISPWENESFAWPNVSLKKKVRYYKRKVLYALRLQKQKYMAVKRDMATGKYNIKIQ